MATRSKRKNGSGTTGPKQPPPKSGSRRRLAPARDRPRLGWTGSSETFAWLRARLGPQPFDSLDNADRSERDAIMDLGLARYRPAAATLLAVLIEHPDESLRSSAADALLCFNQPRLLEAVASQLEVDRWAGGLVARQAVAALFKLDPARARQRLQPAFDHLLAHPNEVQVVALTALQVLFEDFLPRSRIQEEWRATRNMPEQLFAHDRAGWVELCYELRICNHSTHQRIPLTILRMVGDPRWLDAVWDGLDNNSIANICMALRAGDDPAAAPRLRALAKTAVGREQRLLLTTALHLERSR